MIFSDGAITYSIHGNLCVVEYEDWTDINEEVSKNLLKYKKQVLNVFPHVNKFMGVQNDTIKTNPKYFKMYTTKEAMDGIDFLAVVFISDKFIKGSLNNIGKHVLNFFIKLLIKQPKIKVFTSRAEAYKWINSK